MRFFRLNISPRTRRKLGRYWSRVSWYVGYPFYHLRNLFVAIGTMFAEWWRRRNLRYLLQGLPSLLLTAGVILFGLLVFAQDRNLLANDYQRQGYQSILDAKKKLSAGDDATPQLAMAEMCFQRLLVLQNKDVNLYMLAQVLDVRKQSEAVIDLLRTMAPGDKTRYGLAHLNMAELYLTGKLPPPPGSSPGRAAENHLKRAVWSKDPSAAPRANLMLSELYKVWNMPKEAEKHLEDAAKAVPEWRGFQAEWFRRKGQPDQAKLYAQMAAQVFRRRLEKEPDNHTDRASLADALVLMGDFPEAVETLRLGATLAQENEQLHRNYAVKASTVYVSWYLAKKDDPKISLSEKFDLLQKALEWFPNNINVFPLLISLSHQTGPEAEKARQAVVDRTMGDKPSWMAHLYLGMDAWASNNVPDARHHWERAFELSKGAPLVANNLAWVVANYPPGNEDPQRGLVMIDEAIKQLEEKEEPVDPRFYGTRGHILAKLGRHKEALPELEKSIPGNQNDETLFRQLADTCEKLDMNKLSEDYRRRADEIKRKMAGPVRRPLPGPDGAAPDAPKDAPPTGPGGDAKPPAGTPAPATPKTPTPPVPPGGKAAPAGTPGKQ